MHKFSRIVARNSAFGMAAQLIIKVLSFGFSILIVRNLGAEDFGQYAAILAFGALFVFVADLGLSVYAVREVARWRDTADDIERSNSFYGNVLLLRFALSVLAALLIIGTAWLTGRPLVMIGAIALGTLGLMMYSVQGASDAVLGGYERLDLSAGSKVTYQIVFVTAGALALWLGLGYYGLILANLLGIALMTYVCWSGVRRLGIRPGRPDPGAWPGILRRSIPFGVIGFTLGLSYKFDSVLLNVFRGDSETGYYNAAYSLVFSTVILSNVVNTSLYPSLSRQAVNDPLSLPRIYERALRYLLLLSLPIAVGGSVLAAQIVPFLFGAEYMPAIPALQIVIWVVPLMFASEFLGYVVLVAGQESRVARAVLISTSINVLCNALLIPRFGFISAAVLTVLTEMVLVSQYVWLLRDTMRSVDWGQSLLRPLVAALLMGSLVYALHGLPLLLNIALGAIVYGGLLIALGVIGSDELRFVQSFRRQPVAGSQ